MISGSGEAREAGASYRDSVVRLGETSTEAMRDKLRFVMTEMEGRLASLGFGWRDAVSTQAYSVHDIGPLVRQEIFMKGAAAGGLEWHFCRPPVVNLEYEMDVRGAARELVL